MKHWWICALWSVITPSTVNSWIDACALDCERNLSFFTAQTDERMEFKKQFEFDVSYFFPAPLMSSPVYIFVTNFCVQSSVFAAQCYDNSNSDVLNNHLGTIFALKQICSFSFLNSISFFQLGHKIECLWALSAGQQSMSWKFLNSLHRPVCRSVEYQPRVCDVFSSGSAQCAWMQYEIDKNDNICA